MTESNDHGLSRQRRPCCRPGSLPGALHLHSYITSLVARARVVPSSRTLPCVSSFLSLSSPSWQAPNSIRATPLTPSPSLRAEPLTTSTRTSSFPLMFISDERYRSYCHASLSLELEYPYASSASYQYCAYRVFLNQKYYLQLYRQWRRLPRWLRGYDPLYSPALRHDPLGRPDPPQLRLRHPLQLHRYLNPWLPGNPSARHLDGRERPGNDRSRRRHSAARVRGSGHVLQPRERDRDRELLLRRPRRDRRRHDPRRAISQSVPPSLRLRLCLSKPPRG